MPIIFSTISTTANTALIAVPPGFAAPAGWQPEEDENQLDELRLNVVEVK
jgi:hypothetical protein